MALALPPLQPVLLGEKKPAGHRGKGQTEQSLYLLFYFSKMNLNDMYSTLPKSLTMELAVKTKVIVTMWHSPNPFHLIPTRSTTLRWWRNGES